MNTACCELSRCISNHSVAVVDCNENIEDSSYRARICQPCADVLGVRPFTDLPEAAELDRIITKFNRNRRNARKK